MDYEDNSKFNMQIAYLRERWGDDPKNWLPCFIDALYRIPPEEWPRRLIQNLYDLARHVRNDAERQFIMQKLKDSLISTIISRGLRALKTDEPQELTSDARNLLEELLPVWGALSKLSVVTEENALFWLPSSAMPNDIPLSWNKNLLLAMADFADDGPNGFDMFDMKTIFIVQAIADRTHYTRNKSPKVSAADWQRARELFERKRFMERFSGC